MTGLAAQPEQVPVGKVRICPLSLWELLSVTPCLFSTQPMLALLASWRTRFRGICETRATDSRPTRLSVRCPTVRLPSGIQTQSPYRSPPLGESDSHQKLQLQKTVSERLWCGQNMSTDTCEWYGAGVNGPSVTRAILADPREGNWSILRICLISHIELLFKKVIYKASKAPYKTKGEYTSPVTL